MNRRGLLAAALATFAAPALVRAESLMKLHVPRRLVLWGDAVHDDTRALQALLDGAEVVTPAGIVLKDRKLIGGHYRLTAPVHIERGSRTSIRGASFIADARYPDLMAANGYGPVFLRSYPPEEVPNVNEDLIFRRGWPRARTESPLSGSRPVLWIPAAEG